ncbi:hypothetical protein [Sphingomonas sp. ACRSK]|uniref:hypothetical protein n=1 Tax=Sphingomonas sp. ACRSK TaxID=2918213 RepID=UPI001EF581E5|nr:hypothetical protein [Sphingomonas sp. ACRSK]MCG7348895.1 hypothetical protein [Sphingomonas sp. ACRSK]
MSGRFWVLGPVVDKGGEQWGVVDGHDMVGTARARKPKGYREFWPTQTEADAHAASLNKETAA